MSKVLWEIKGQQKYFVEDVALLGLLKMNRIETSGYGEKSFKCKQKHGGKKKSISHMLGTEVVQSQKWSKLWMVFLKLHPVQLWGSMTCYYHTEKKESTVK